MRRALIAAMTIAMLALLAACGGSESTTPTPDGGGTQAAESGSSPEAPAIKEGGILRMGTTSGPDSINPFVSYSAISYIFYTETYPTLVQYNEAYEIEGDWAESWETSDDGLVWTFKLKEGGAWSDGTPMTAEDAAFTGNLIVEYSDGPASMLAPFLSYVTSVEAPDPNTVVITYEQPVGNVLPQLQQFFILPKHVLEPVVGDKGKGLKKWDPMADGAQVGGGTFFIKQYEDKGTTILEKNPGFYGTPANVDAVGLTVYQNADAMLAALDNGQIDAVDSVPPTLVSKYENNPAFQLQIGDSTFIYDIGFNSNPDKPKNRELLDPKVREALAHGVNRQAIIDTVLNGYGKPAATMFTTLSGQWNNTDIQPEAFDLDLGNQILDDLGYEKGSDGIRIKPDGGKMEYEVVTPDTVDGQDRLVQIIAADWEKLGVKITQKKMDGTAAFEAIGAPDWKYEEFDIMMWNWVGYIDPDFMLSVITCDQWGGWSDTGYCNAAYDELYKKQAVTVDQEERRQIVWEMQQIQYDDKPYIQVAQTLNIAAYTQDWTNLTDPFLLGMSKIPWERIAKKG